MEGVTVLSPLMRGQVTLHVVQVTTTHLRLPYLHIPWAVDPSGFATLKVTRGRGDLDPSPTSKGVTLGCVNPKGRLHPSLGPGVIPFTFEVSLPK